MTDVVKIDVTKLTPLSPEVISKQATINIGKMTTNFFFVLKQEKKKRKFVSLRI